MKKYLFLMILFCLCFAQPAAGASRGASFGISPDSLASDFPKGADGESVENDIVRIFGNATVEHDETVKDAVFIFSEGTIKGALSGDCVAIGGKLHLKDGARLDGDLVTIFSTLERDRGVEVRGSQVNIGSYETSGLTGFIEGIFSAWDFMLALLLLLFFWRYAHRLTDRFLLNPSSCALTGFLGLMGFVPALVLLAISIAGILLIPLLPFLYLWGFTLGFAVMGNLMGEKISRLAGKEFRQPVKAILGLLAILVMLKLLALFPLLGALTAEVIKMVMRTLGLGLLLQTLWEGARSRKAA